MIQQRPARYNAPLRVTTTPNRAPHKNRLFFFGLCLCLCLCLRSTCIRTPAIFAHVPEEDWWMRPAISADRRRSTSGLSNSCSGARPPTPRSLARLPHLSKPSCLPCAAALGAACQPATNERGLQSKFHDDDRFPRPDILTTRPPAFRLVISHDSHRLTDFRGSLTPPYRGRITRGFLMAFGFWRCVLTPLPPYSPFFFL
ncbi:hypothetical protein BDP67DRAFT_523475 [Colletotrichum lupini]|nr:hypothetical protein BDP67DRAFT_523475 [Colletotrichum lupini]